MFFSRQQHHLCFPCIKTLLPVLNTFFALIVLAGCGNSSPSPTAIVSLDAETFDFGNNLVNNTLTRKVVTVSNTGSSVLTIRPALSGDASFSIASTGSCGQQLTPGTPCDLVVNYSPTAPSFPFAQNATLNLGLGGVPADTHQAVAITGTAAALTPGQVSVTNNPQVALYTMRLPFPGSVTVNFGPDTNYGLKTWSQTTESVGGQIGIFVAGMRASSTYHMQAQVTFAGGIAAKDSDHTFTTKAVSSNMQLNVTTATSAGKTPQSGVELLNPLVGKPSGVIVTDLAGNTLWAYENPSDLALNYVNGVKMLPSGTFLMVLGVTAPFDGAVPNKSINEIREVNLAGDTLRKISIEDLNSALTSATCIECHVKLVTFHHDVEPLLNGHWLVLANTAMDLSNASTPALTNVSPTTVLGDVVIDLDQNMKPVWVWNAFNHLDPNRHPLEFPDWTHANAVVYSKDDGNLLVSMRNQNWILKVNYADGMGDGRILWRLGEEGDFSLAGGTEPIDWAYAQHFPSFFSTNTTGVFSLGAVDNGNDRAFPSGVVCGSTGGPPCRYSSIPVWRINESSKVATLIFHQVLPANLYNSFGGNIEQLANSNVEYDLCGVGSDSYVYEVTQEKNPEIVWSMHVTGTYLYRAVRMPSLYPGVQW